MNASSPPPPLADADIERLQQALDRVGPPLEPLDVTMLDGFLCGVLLQPTPVPAARWLPFVTDLDGRPLPPKIDTTALHGLVRRRHAELERAIAAREWFDPWVFEHDAEDGPDPIDEGDESDEGDAPTGADAVYPWVAGFVLAMEHFPALMDFGDDVLTEPLALLYRHLAADDLEDADALLAEIESLEPPADLSVAVEELVRATLLLADISRPRTPERTSRGPAPRRPGGGGSRGGNRRPR